MFVDSWLNIYPVSISFRDVNLEKVYDLVREDV